MKSQFDRYANFIERCKNDPPEKVPEGVNLVALAMGEGSFEHEGDSIRFLDWREIDDPYKEKEVDKVVISRLSAFAVVGDNNKNYFFAAVSLKEDAGKFILYDPFTRDRIGAQDRRYEKQD